jgi:hypothetical protein
MTAVHIISRCGVQDVYEPYKWQWFTKYGLGDAEDG